MNSTILGKRTRSRVASSKASLPRSQNSGSTVISSDDDENPFVVRKARRAIKDGKSTGLHTSNPTFTISTPSRQGLRPRPVSSVSKTETETKTKSKSRDEKKFQPEDENSPPVQILTPQTPRHKDALSKRVPVTPSHRLILPGPNFTPQTPRSPMTPGRSITTIYSQARQIFTRSSVLGELVGREAERKRLATLVQNSLSKGASRCIYISGPPGTGKSAIVNEVIDSLKVSTSVRKLYINCMSMNTSKLLYSHLLDEFCSDMELFEGEEVNTLENLFIPRGNSKISYIVTLDEIDHILTLDLEVMYKLFEWALHKESRLILIGIANALDLTDRFLPRLKARGLKPQLIPFSPYTADEIKTVIISRLKSLMPVDSDATNYVPFLHPTAIDFCARKVSSQTGDIRKAFDICRRAIDMIESETKQKHQHAINERLFKENPFQRSLEEDSNLPSQRTPYKNLLADSLAALTVETAPRASLSHVNKITSSTFGNGATQRLKSFNLQQKAAICTLVALEKRKRNTAANLLASPSKSKDAAPTIKALYDVYCMLCSRDRILHPLTSVEFRDVIGSLETLSLVSTIDGRNGSFAGMGTPNGRSGRFMTSTVTGESKRVASCVAENEVAQVAEGIGGGILKSILSGEGFD